MKKERWFWNEREIGLHSGIAHRLVAISFISLFLLSPFLFFIVIHESLFSKLIELINMKISLLDDYLNFQNHFFFTRSLFLSFFLCVSRVLRLYFILLFWFLFFALFSFDGRDYCVLLRRKEKVKRNSILFNLEFFFGKNICVMRSANNSESKQLPFSTQTLFKWIAFFLMRIRSVTFAKLIREGTNFD